MNETNEMNDDKIETKIGIFDNCLAAVLSASMVIKECEKWAPDGELSNYPDNNTPLGYLVDKVRWAPHGFINALQSHVKIIYTYQEAVLNKEAISPPREEALVICKSLDIYQNWKTRIIEEEQKLYGQEWGSGSGFNDSVWNNNNNRFLDLYK